MLAFGVLGRPPLTAADQASFATWQRELARQWRLIATDYYLGLLSGVVPSHARAPGSEHRVGRDGEGVHDGDPSEALLVLQVFAQHMFAVVA